MKKGKNVLILAVLLILLLGGAGVAYSALRQNTAQESVSVMPETEQNPTEAGMPEKSGTVPEIQSAPDFTFLNAEGEETRLADLTGKPILINFWATWCPPCKEELPCFQKAYAEYGQQVQFLMMNETDGVRDTVESAAAFVQENGYDFPLCFDNKGQGGQAYSVMYIPVTVFITAEGKLAYQHVGAITEEALFSMLERHLNEN